MLISSKFQICLSSKSILFSLLCDRKAAALWTTFCLACWLFVRLWPMDARGSLEVWRKKRLFPPACFLFSTVSSPHPGQPQLTPTCETSFFLPLLITLKIQHDLNSAYFSEVWAPRLPGICSKFLRSNSSSPFTQGGSGSFQLRSQGRLCDSILLFYFSNYTKYFAINILY